MEKPIIGKGKPFPPPLPNSEDFAVTFDGPEDPSHPYNWKLSTKYVSWQLSTRLRAYPLTFVSKQTIQFYPCLFWNLHRLLNKRHHRTGH